VEVREEKKLLLSSMEVTTAEVSTPAEHMKVVLISQLFFYYVYVYVYLLRVVCNKQLIFSLVSHSLSSWPERNHQIRQSIPNLDINNDIIDLSF
jgi:hypothetical protein